MPRLQPFTATCRRIVQPLRPFVKYFSEESWEKRGRTGQTGTPQRYQL